MTRGNESTIRRLIFYTFLVLFAAAVNASAIKAESLKMPYPEYSYKKHPMIKHSLVRNAVPVIMKKYIYLFGAGFIDIKDVVFTPGKANYVNYKSTQTFAEDLDSLCVPPVSLNEGDADHFLEVELNGPARVFILLVPKSTGADLETVTSVTGLDNTWTNIQAVSSKNGGEITIGGTARHCKCKLPANAVSLEKNVAAGEKLIVPLPQKIMLNGDKVTKQIHLLFARPGPKGSSPVAFPFPETPTRIRDLMTGKSISTSRVKPNEMCPPWLHALHITASKTGGKYGEPKYWRTWHPIVDPIYWCYYDHEHGSYPGNYEPQFDYTAFKVKDESTPNGKQAESDEGFKVFAVALPDQQRFVIITVHMQCSKARRIWTRFHTSTFAVLDKNWNLELELNMKVDFGAGVASRKGGKAQAINKEQEEIMKNLFKMGQPRKRRINVLDLTNYPSSVDPQYVVRKSLPVTMANQRIIELGVYEKWSGGPNTCSSVDKKSFFSFDSRNVATAKRKITDDSKSALQTLRGDSMDRKLVVSAAGVKIGVEHCKFDNYVGKKGVKAFVSSKGVFYTDAYFSTVMDMGGPYSVRQFIKPGFEAVSLKGEDYLPVSPWGGYYVAGHGARRGKFMNIEDAVSKFAN